MAIREELLDEAEYEPYIRALVYRANYRIQPQIVTGENWVRLRPPSRMELESDAENPFLVKFYRIGSVVQVDKVLTDFVEIVCGGHSLLMPTPEFLATWVRIENWTQKAADRK